jgi:hypothetical protein
MQAIVVIIINRNTNRVITQVRTSIYQYIFMKNGLPILEKIYISFTTSVESLYESENTILDPNLKNFGSATLVSSVCHVQCLSCPRFVVSSVCRVQCLSCPRFVVSSVFRIQCLSCPEFFLSKVCRDQGFSC